MSRIIVLIGVLVSATAAFSAPLWYAYEGDDYPGNVGWERFTLGGGAQRSLADSTLTLDGLSSTQIVDEYLIYTPLVLGPGETFRMEWRLRVDAAPNGPDAGVGISAGPHGYVTFDYATDHLVNYFEGATVYFPPGMFHNYVFVSSNMTSYTLYLDGSVARTGYFIGPASSSVVGWGDGGQGAASMSTWDFVRFGIVPEPASALGLALAGARVIRCRTHESGNHTGGGR